jgi:predicted dehydrogenase
MPQIGVAMIGSGGIALANHVPGLALCPEAKLVALCDTNPATLEKASKATGVSVTSTDYNQILKRDDVHAVIVATPNFVHAPIVLAAVAAGKHVLCEKPIAMDLAEAVKMYKAAEAAKVRHMTAFTYRFVPAMHYMSHLVQSGSLGKPYHFRAQRFQDWGDRNLAWRQVKKLAATGELGDMLSHRIDYGHFLVGPMARVSAALKRFIDVRGGEPSDLDDWVAMLSEFEAGATGVLESTKLASGRGEGGRSPDVCEVNGTEGSAIYQLGKPLELQIGRKGAAGMETVAVPKEFLAWPGSRRDPKQGDPIVTFRYDQDAEFIDAIVNQRPCRPSFLDGVRVQAVMEAALISDRERRWVEVPQTF